MTHCKRCGTLIPEPVYCLKCEEGAIADQERLDAWFALQAGMVTDMGSLPRSREEFDYILEVMQGHVKKAIEWEAGKI